MNRIGQTFRALRAAGRTALIPYITGGDPSLEATEALIPALIDAGADLVEIGIPYSDPLADGPTIQRAAQRALDQGTTVSALHATVRRLRTAGLSAPLLYLVYYNCIYRQGEERFLDEAREAGIDGLIVPDLPLEEGVSLHAAASERGVAVIPLLAPTSTPSRIELAAARSPEFIYCVSLTGVTGARGTLSGSLAPFLERIRAATAAPLAVGFGVSTADHARSVAEVADGVIVGSALINELEKAQNTDEAVRRGAKYIRTLRAAVDAADGQAALQQTSAER